jgi:hypothetical protein
VVPAFSSSTLDRRNYQRTSSGELRGLKRLRSLAVVVAQQKEVVRADTQILVGFGQYMHFNEDNPGPRINPNLLSDFGLSQCNGCRDLDVIVRGGRRGGSDMMTRQHCCRYARYARDQQSMEQPGSSFHRFYR